VKKLTRRQVLQTSMAGGIAALSGTTRAHSSIKAQSANADLPNILLILSDDHSVPHLGCYGDSGIRTPNLDRFAAEGLRFNRAYTSAPQCSPSRASIFTGLPPQRVCMSRLAAPLPPEHVTFMELLRDNQQYYTGVCGRWHHMDGRIGPNPQLKKIYEQHNMQQFANRVDYCSYERDRMLHMRRFLDQVPSGQPFFLQMGFNDPHYKWDSDAIPEPHDPDKIKVPPYLPDIPSLRESLARHFDEIARMDKDFGDIIHELDERELRNNTLVIFMGDNGLAFPRGKGTLYQPGVNVPMLARWPGVIEAGRVTDELVGGVDMGATFLDIAGVDIPNWWESRSFRNLLTGDTYNGRDFLFTASGWHNREGISALDSLDLCRSAVSRTHSFIYNCLPHQPHRAADWYREQFWVDMKSLHQKGQLATEFGAAYFNSTRPVFELFDLQSDPHEFRNLAGDSTHRVVEAQMKAALDEWMHANYDFLPPPTMA